MSTLVDIFDVRSLQKYPRDQFHGPMFGSWVSEVDRLQCVELSCFSVCLESRGPVAQQQSPKTV